MKKHIKWMFDEIERWVSDGVIKPEQADVIRARYSDKEQGAGWGTAIFSGIGGVILGLGVILLFAYNWHVIPKYGKLGIVFASLAVAHSVAIFLYVKSERFKVLGDAIGLVGTMLFGAGIWLVAQIYHINEHFPNAFIIWSIGAMAMAWAMSSVLQGILAAVLIAVWCGSEAISFDTAMHAGPLLIVLLIGALAYVKKSRVLLAVIIPTFFVSLIFVLIGLYEHSGLMFGTALNIATLLVAAGILMKYEPRFPESSAVFLFYGWVTSVVILYVLTFPEAARHLLKFEYNRENVWPLWYWGCSSVLTVVAWVFVAYMSLSKRDEKVVTVDSFLLPLTVLLSIFYMKFGGGPDKWFVAGPFNLVFIALVVAMMTRGCRHGLMKPTVIGSILMMIYSFTRYFDLFHSLLARGFVFIIAGVLIFGQGVLYARARKQKAGKF